MILDTRLPLFLVRWKDRGDWGRGYLSLSLHTLLHDRHLSLLIYGQLVDWKEMQITQKVFFEKKQVTWILLPSPHYKAYLYFINTTSTVISIISTWCQSSKCFFIHAVWADCTQRLPNSTYSGLSQRSFNIPSMLHIVQKLRHVMNAQS